MDRSPEQVGLDALVGTGLHDRIPVDVDELARRLGVDVEEIRAQDLVGELKNRSADHLATLDVQKRFSAVLLSRGKTSPPLVLIRSDLPASLRRSALAHELAHFLNGDHKTKTLFGRISRPAMEPRFKSPSRSYIRYEQRRMERRADRVGHALLMNPRVFRDDLRTHALFQLATKYQVRLSEVMDYAVTLDVCPIARLVGWYDPEHRRVHEFDALLSPSARLELVLAVQAFNASVNDLEPVIQEWMTSSRKWHSAQFQVRASRICVAVYRHAVASRLILLFGEADTVQAQGLESGLFRPITPELR